MAKTFMGRNSQRTSRSTVLLSVNLRTLDPGPRPERGPVTPWTQTVDPVARPMQ